MEIGSEYFDVSGGIVVRHCVLLSRLEMKSNGYHGAGLKVI
ncbi:MAG: hypothetical protein ACJ71J_04585 [Nitrososphaeraceae archaeon]